MHCYIYIIQILLKVNHHNRVGVNFDKKKNVYKKYVDGGYINDNF